MISRFGASPITITSSKPSSGEASGATRMPPPKNCPLHTAQVEIETDGNSDPNALSPQALEIDGQWADIRLTVGSPEAPMDAAQSLAKYDLCRALAGNCDPRLFDDPLAYFTDPR